MFIKGLAVSFKRIVN